MGETRGFALANLEETRRHTASRGDFAKLGYERRALDAIFRACDVIVLDGYSRPLINSRRLPRLSRALPLRRARSRPLT